jgi:hypothetical protein
MDDSHPKYFQPQIVPALGLQPIKQPQQKTNLAQIVYTDKLRIACKPFGIASALY